MHYFDALSDDHNTLQKTVQVGNARRLFIVLIKGVAIARPRSVCSGKDYGQDGRWAKFTCRNLYFLLIKDLEIKAVLLDEILRDPENPTTDLLLELEVKSLRDTRDLLDKVGKILVASNFYPS